MGLEVDYANSLINVTSPTVTVDVQDLIDTIRTAEATEEGITYSKIADASGKESLGGSVSVGITVDLQDPWQLSFWSTGSIVKVSGGNLVGGIGGDPIAYTAGVQVLLIQSAASTVVATGGSALTTEESDHLMALANGLTTAEGQQLDDIHKSHMNKRVRNSSTGVITIYDDDGTTPYAEFDSNADLSEITPK